MALSAGTVLLVGDGHSGSGLALALYEAEIQSFTDADPTRYADEGDIPLDVRTFYRHHCVRLATALVDYLVANTVVTVTVQTTDSALQRMPASTAEDTPTKGPASPKTLSGTVA